MIFSAYGKIVSVNKGIPVWLFVCCVWEESQSKATRDFQRRTHVMAISLTISLDYSPKMSLLPELELPISVLLSQCCKLFCERVG